jgi:TonB family protein
VNAPLRKVLFDPGAEPTFGRPEHLRTAARPSGDRAVGVAITVIAHIAVALALVLAFRAAKPLVQPRLIMAKISDEKVKPEKLEVVMPKFTPPPQLYVPVPAFDIAPSPNAITAAPPRPEPQPAMPSPAPVRDTGESRATYLGTLLAQLNRFKHYPPEAKSARIEGVVMLHFIIDRNGRLLSAEIAKSSGRPALDREALALVARAEPLPAMPTAMQGDTLDAIVPINFSLH